MPYYGFDIYYLVLILPAMALAVFAQFKVKSAYNKYSKIENTRRVTGFDAARRIAPGDMPGGMPVEQIDGNLTDHYDPKANVIRLSRGVYSGSSIAAVGIAAHEAGHALQHAEGYAPIKIRNAFLPVANIGSQLAFPLILAGFIFSYSILINVGIIFFSAAVLFQIITLPVEFDASRRALKIMAQDDILSREELTGARKVLTAAAMTYVAAALLSLAQLVRLILLSQRRR